MIIGAVLLLSGCLHIAPVFTRRELRNHVQQEEVFATDSPCLPSKHTWTWGGGWQPQESAEHSWGDARLLCTRRRSPRERRRPSTYLLPFHPFEDFTESGADTAFSDKSNPSVRRRSHHDRHRRLRSKPRGKTSRDSPLRRELARSPASAKKHDREENAPGESFGNAAGDTAGDADSEGEVSGRVYYAPTGGVNYTTPTSTVSGSVVEGSVNGARGGGYKPMCGVDVVVSPGRDDQYRLYWEWLPAFAGVQGRINELGGAEDTFVESVFIGGEFTPPVLVWTNDPDFGPSTTTQPGKKSEGTAESGGAAAGVAHSTHGGVSTLSPGRNGKDGNHALLMAMVLVCMTLAVCLGAGMAFVCHKQEFMNVPWLKDMVEGRNGISLTTLAGPQGLLAGAEAEFRLRFERAMQSRHLVKGHNLNIINPKEIMLHKIIGEESFGRVWSGRWRSSSVAVKEFVFVQAAISGGSLQRNELIEEIVGEAAIMSFLQHPRILHLYGCSLTSQVV